MKTAAAKLVALLLTIALVPLAIVALPAGAEPWPDSVVISEGSELGGFDLRWGEMGRQVRDPANFGVGGIVPVATTLKLEASVITPEYLSDVDVYFDGWVDDINWTDDQLDSLVDWVDGGGVLIGNEDSDFADALAERFGVPIVTGRWVMEETSTATHEPTDPDHPIADGPFGTWSLSSARGTYGYFEPVLPEGWTVLGLDELGNNVILYRPWGEGHVIMTSDEALFRPEINPVIGKNIIAWAISLTVDEPDPTPTATATATPTPTVSPTPIPTPIPTPTPTPPVIMCKGVPATIVGTSGDDSIVGTDGPDVIHALGGDDEVFGGRGRDLICGGPGADDLDGGSAGDSIYGQRGRDVIRGGTGDDLLDGGSARDTIYGNNGEDTIIGGSASDTISGGRHADHISGGSGPDIINGGKGPDILNGEGGRDTISGNTGFDSLSGGSAGDNLDGGRGFDTCAGGTGIDTWTRCELTTP